MSDAQLERLAVSPRLERGLSRWAAWESERTGFGLGFRAGAFFPPFFPLNFSSDHYANPITGKRENEINPAFGVYLTWSAKKAKLLNSDGVHAFVTRHPWAYLGLRRSEPPKNKGTLVFLPHSRKGSATPIDWGSFFSHLNSLPRKYRPFSLCLGAQDITNGFHKEVRKFGFPLYTAGDVMSQLFPYRFWRLISRFSYTAGINTGSHAFYCIWAGRPYRLFGTDSWQFWETNSSGVLEQIPHEVLFSRDYPDDETALSMTRFEESLFRDFDTPSDQQSEFVRVTLEPSNSVTRTGLIRIVWGQLLFPRKTE